MKIKLLSIFLVAILLVNMVLFALGMIKGIYFWMIIIIIGVIAYKVIPLVNKIR